MLAPNNLQTKAELDAWYETLTEDQKDSYISFAIGGNSTPRAREPWSICEMENACDQDEGA